MRISLVILALFVLAPGCKKGKEDKPQGADNAGWHEVRADKDKFRFEFPAKSTAPRSDDVAGATLTTYQVKETSNDFWQVQTMPLPPFLTEMNEEALSAGFGQAVANMLAAMNADKTDEKRIEVGGMPAIEVRATGYNRDREFRIVTRLIVSKERNMLYQMMALRPDGEPDAAKATLFFDSFRLIE